MKPLAAIIEEAGAELPDLLIEVIKEASQLRDAATHEATPTEGPADLHEQLIAHRRSLDRLEDYAAKMNRLRSRADREVRASRDRLEDAEVNAEQLKEEYSTALERSTHMKMQTLDQRIELRRLERQRDEIAEVQDYVKTLYRGLDGSRRDIDSRIRLITLQTSLEK